MIEVIAVSTVSCIAGFVLMLFYLMHKGGSDADRLF